MSAAFLKSYASFSAKKISHVIASAAPSRAVFFRKAVVFNVITIISDKKEILTNFNAIIYLAQSFFHVMI